MSKTQNLAKTNISWHGQNALLFSNPAWALSWLTASATPAVQRRRRHTVVLLAHGKRHGCSAATPEIHRRAATWRYTPPLMNEMLISSAAPPL